MPMKIKRANAWECTTPVVRQQLVLHCLTVSSPLILIVRMDIIKVTLYFGLSSLLIGILLNRKTLLFSYIILLMENPAISQSEMGNTVQATCCVTL